ncbi:hypothetical protein [Xenorhabdus griffiniae]|uniref:Uncharacterized protein n=1 Tax=Xenorhabdus griffiniae TaxID=351672 RepID=A0ABY9XF21_9GAMM|nr:hypothetical protein [Xenorhabdus griffiniae]MBD1228887.1 hypothetical protein [Xenorhabdus griffiniae]MBE8588559.1 hypothetical protein [Xenorhabdus griffiniae]WMV71526.1 hypothetical protein QL128_15420 [Xenorhabdus griffiniae]WNH01203.1 hypothetical protein QL112_015425 [Xenorhabdus griffiniae]
MTEIPKDYVIQLVRKSLRASLIITLVIIITLLTGWLGLTHPEKASVLHHWMEKTGILWRIWRFGLYLVLAWGGWKIGQRTTHQPEYRAALIRMMVVSLLFILLGEYALSDSIEGIS